MKKSVLVRVAGLTDKDHERIMREAERLGMKAPFLRGQMLRQGLVALRNEPPAKTSEA